VDKDKTGVKLDGVTAINPLTGREIPIFISDYVLVSYGTGAIMAVPAHDTRDWEFAKKFDLPIIEVVKGGNVEEAAFTDCDTGIMVNSGILDGLTVEEAKEKIKTHMEEKGFGHRKVNFKLRDWVFSRQRYWGEPIPLVYCDKCGWQAIPESELPLKLPNVESYEPTDDGESPLAKMTDWVNTTCPCCGGPARRETDTMPNWAGSSWYFLRYMDPHNKTEAVSKAAEEYWGPVDWYNGGMEHTTLHLLYSRFWHKFLYDIGVVHTKEPYAKRTSHGMILGQNPHYVGNVDTEEEKQALIEKYGNQALRPSVKMSKSLGNVVNPDDVVKEFGADTLRLYIMFIGDFEKTATWSTSAVRGCKKFLDRCWNLMDMATPEEQYSPKNEAVIHRSIKKVTEDIDSLKMNTAIAQLMTMVNEFYANGLSKGDLRALMLMLSPFAPHMVEEMWELTGFAAETGKMAMQCDWPQFDEAKMVEQEKEIAVQVGGKLRATVVIPLNADDETVLGIVYANEKIARLMEGMEVVKTIIVKNKLVNLILKPAK
jgi:leucyl-tRNA synthetase